MTVAEVARRLGLYRSNLSAMDAGRRAVSLQALSRIAAVLGCSPGELLERNAEGSPAVFQAPALNTRLAARDVGLEDGADRAWVHASLLAWQRHYRARA